MKPKLKSKPKFTPIPKREKRIASPHEHMFREAFLPDRKVRKPLLVREKPERSGGILWGMMLLWMFFLSVAAYTLFFSDFHTIRTVEVSGTKDVSSEKIEAFVRERLAQKALRVFPQDNFFLVPTDSLGRDLLRAFPKLASVSVSRDFPSGIRIGATERDRILLWCSGDSCFLIGDDGVAQDASSAETPENEPFLLRVYDDSAGLVDIGKPLFEMKSARAIIRLATELPDRGFTIALPFHSPSSVSDEVRITTEEGWDILVNLAIDPGKTIASLQLVLDKEIPADRRSALRYIDLRTENRAFFAYRDWTPPPDATATTPSPGSASATASQASSSADTSAKRADTKKK
ncbi:MAG: FtsQ-type POTRA domain-containing protein [Candidatus Moraniibacteriota bacterium]